MPAGPEPGEPGRHVPGCDARGAGQRGCGERVGEPGRPAGVHVGDAGELHARVRVGAGCSESGFRCVECTQSRFRYVTDGRERAIDQRVAHDAELAR